MERLAAGEDIDLSTADKHTRLCYIVAMKGQIRREYNSRDDLMIINFFTCI